MLHILAQATQPSAPTTWGTLLQTVMAAVIATLTPFLVKFLRARAAAATAEATAHDADAANSDANTRTELLAQLKAFVYEAAAEIAEQRFPILAQQLTTQQISSASDIRVVLESWGEELKTDVINHFGTQGIDIVSVVGEKYIDSLIASAANAVSPIPGASTATVLAANPAVVDGLIAGGVGYAKKLFLASLPSPTPVTPPAPAAASASALTLTSNTPLFPVA